MLQREELLETAWISELEEFDEPPFSPRDADIVDYLEPVAEHLHGRAQLLLAAEYLSWIASQLAASGANRDGLLIAVSFFDDLDGNPVPLGDVPEPTPVLIPNLLVVPATDSFADPMTLGCHTPIARLFSDWLAEAARQDRLPGGLRVVDLEGGVEAPHRLLVLHPSLVGVRQPRVQDPDQP